MRLMIFEPTGGGHRMTYIRQMLGALDRLSGVEPLLVVGERAKEGKDYAAQIEPILDRVEIQSVPVAGEGTPKDALRAMTGAVKQIRPDRLLVPTADGIAQLLTLHPGALKGVEQTDLVVHSAGFALPAPNTKTALKRRLSMEMLGRTSGTRIRFVNGLAMDWLEARKHRLLKNASVLPDPVDSIGSGDRSAAREALDLPKDASLLVSAGQQNERKGVHLLIDAFAYAHEHDIPVGTLVLIGGCSPGVRDRLSALDPSARERVIVMDRYVNDEELYNALVSADVVANCSPAHVGLSNIALRAAGVERPVLASDAGWLGTMVPRHKLGWSADARDARTLADAMARALEDAPAWTPTEELQRLVRFHGPENFRATVRSWYSGEDAPMTWQDLRAG